MLALVLPPQVPVAAFFPALFACIVYPMAGLQPSPLKFVKFMSVLALESFTAGALGLAIGAAAPTPEAAVALGPAVMLMFIVLGGGLSFLPRMYF